MYLGACARVLVQGCLWQGCLSSVVFRFHAVNSDARLVILALLQLAAYPAPVCLVGEAGHECGLDEWITFRAFACNRLFGAAMRLPRCFIAVWIWFCEDLVLPSDESIAFGGVSACPWA